MKGTCQVKVQGAITKIEVPPGRFVTERFDYKGVTMRTSLAKLEQLLATDFQLLFDDAGHHEPAIQSMLHGSHYDRLHRSGRMVKQQFPGL